jgi:hypothetical protein
MTLPSIHLSLAERRDRPHSRGQDPDHCDG